MSLKRLCVCLLILLFASAAQAGEGFVGFGLGSSNVEVKDAGQTFDEGDTGWKLYGGYRFLKFFGVEGGYTDLGSPDGMVGGESVQIDPTLFDVYAVGVIPITFVEIYGKVGYAFWDADIMVSGSPDEGDDGNDLAYGLGVGFKIGSKVRIRLEYEMFDIEGSESVDFLSVGFDWRF